MRIERAAEQPVRTVLSGPAAGTVGAAELAALAGVEDVISCDMGGTSFDVALIPGGTPAQTTGRQTSPTASRCSFRWSTSTPSELGVAASPGWTEAASCRSVPSRRAPSRVRRLTGKAGISRPSPTQTSCSDGSAPASAARHRRGVQDRRRGRRGRHSRERISEPLGLTVIEAALRHDPGRQREDGRRDPPGLRRSGPRPEKVRARRVRRRGPGSHRRVGRGDWLQAGADPSAARYNIGPRLPALRRPPRLRERRQCRRGGGRGPSTVGRSSPPTGERGTRLMLPGRASPDDLIEAHHYAEMAYSQADCTTVLRSARQTRSSGWTGHRLSEALSEHATGRSMGGSCAAAT